MKKIFIFLIVILLAYFAYLVYERNKPEEVVEPPYVLDPDYKITFSYDDDLVSKLVKYTYFLYDNTKAVLKVSTADRTTGRLISEEFTEITITDPDFNLNSILSYVNQDNQDLDSFYSYVVYIKDINKSYRLSKNNKAVKALTEALNLK